MVSGELPVALARAGIGGAEQGLQDDGGQLHVEQRGGEEAQDAAWQGLRLLGGKTVRAPSPMIRAGAEKTRRRRKDERRTRNYNRARR